MFQRRLTRQPISSRARQLDEEDTNIINIIDDVHSSQLSTDVTPVVPSVTLEQSHSNTNVIMPSTVPKPRLNLYDEDNDPMTHKNDILKKKKKEKKSLLHVSTTRVPSPSASQKLSLCLSPVAMSKTNDFTKDSNTVENTITFPASVELEIEKSNDIIPVDDDDLGRAGASVASLVREHREKQRYKAEASDLSFGLSTKGKQESMSSTLCKDKVFYRLDRSGLGDESDEDEWERQQALKGSAGIGRRVTPSHRLFAFQNVSLLKTDNKYNIRKDGMKQTPSVKHSMSSLNDTVKKTPFSASLKKQRLQETCDDENLFMKIDQDIQNIHTMLKEVEKQILEAATQFEISHLSKLSAEQKLENLSMDEISDTELEDCQNWLQLIEDFAEFIQEKLPAIEVAEETLAGLEKNYARERAERRFDLLQKTFIQHNVNLGRDTQNEEGSLKQKLKDLVLTDFSLEKEPNHQYSFKLPKTTNKDYDIPNGQGTISFVDNDLYVTDIAAWTNDENRNDDVDLLAQFSKKKEGFVQSVQEIFSDADEEFASVSHFVEMISSIAQRRPQQFRSLYWNLGIRPMVAILIRWDVLFWDPFIERRYWNENLAPKCVSIKKGDYTQLNIIEQFCWYSPIADYVSIVETIDKEEQSENLMSYIVFEIISPRILHWVSDCWDPFSIAQTEVLYELISNILEYYEEPYISKLQAISAAIIDRLEVNANNYIALPHSLPPSASEINTVKNILWKASRLSRVASKLSKILNIRIIQFFCWNVLLEDHLGRILTDDAWLSCLPIEPIILIATAPAPAAAMPSRIANFILTHYTPVFSHSTNDTITCLDMELLKHKLYNT